MKKRLLLSIILFTLGAVAFASTTLSFSGRYALIGENGRTIRRTSVELEDNGFIVATGDERAALEGKDFTIVLGEDTLATIKDQKGNRIIYFVYGYGTVINNSSSPITVYTTTTRAILSGKGEYAFVTEEGEEKVYNFASPEIETYDAIRGKTITLLRNEGYDYAKGRKIALDEEKRYLSLPSTVATPIFVPSFSILEGLDDVPSSPIVLEAIRTLVERDGKDE